MKEEISKPTNIDYSLIEDKSFFLLSQKCKDIRLFSYLAFCYIKKNEWINFCDVFEALAQLCKEKFDSLFPNRLQGKKLALKWLEENRFIDALDSAKITSEFYEHIKRLNKAIELLTQSIKEKFPDNPPVPSKLHASALKWEKLLQPKKEALVPPLQAEKSSTQQNNAPPITNNAPTGAVNIAASVENRPETPKEAIDAIRKYALYLLISEPEKATGYRLLRSSRWGSIDALPVSEGKITKIEPPPLERKLHLQTLLEKGEFKAALENSEKTFSSGTTLYWLDLQRLSATAATQLGKMFIQVKDAIVLETAIFLKRYPEIRNFYYIDETPFCDSETQKWIDKDVSNQFSDRLQTAKNQDNDFISKEKQEVASLIESNSIEAALDFLSNRISQCGGESEKFRRRLLVASCMLSAKRADIALNILELLYDNANNHNLINWDPPLAVEMFTSLIEAYDAVAKSKQGQTQVILYNKRDEIVKKVSYIDPKVAYKYKPTYER